MSVLEDSVKEEQRKWKEKVANRAEELNAQDTDIRGGGKLLEDYPSLLGKLVQ